MECPCLHPGGLVPGKPFRFRVYPCEPSLRHRHYAYDVMDLSLDGESSALRVKPRWRSREEAFMTNSRRLEWSCVMVTVVGWRSTRGRKLEGSLQ